MFKYHTLNAISPKGLVKFTNNYTQTDDADDADAFIVRSAKLHDMEFSDKLAAIARAGAGVNNIPLDRCADTGIVVFNTPGANANAVKELVFAGMLLASRDITGSINWVLENKADADISKNMEKAKKQFAGNELSGKKLGVIGLGAIGQMVANTATHLGMEVYGYDPYISVNAAWNLSRNVHHISNVDDIYKECDFITIHVPLLDSTKGMIDAAAVDKMKKGVVVLNFARDLLVDEKAVLDGIKTGKVKHYVTDFPNPTTAGQPGVIATSHLGASTAEAEENCAMMAVDEIMDYLENGNIHHSVNYPDCDMGVCTSKGRIAILHHNKSGLIAKYTTILGDANVNVSDMTNKSRGDYAYSLIDVDSEVTSDVIEKLNAIPDVIRVRVVK
ncbi:MAG TPA: 3-phosphoglycerate dehydrogenase [Lachnospiraceae bacterium]|nr:phosphoglycerate dehydrogenase [Lachnospiraceae bacterium]MDD7664048.1 phosphoglycerate dehydrogenase [Lachnospiraceae bacterium]MDY4164232.1 phosphoglycerate dehydrogenase [Lachnospiraceae bacterium]HAP02698.1 3-phosphoglycerate dehydrogenase [Lachnospiraceae bacterium]